MTENKTDEKFSLTFTPKCCPSAKSQLSGKASFSLRFLPSPVCVGDPGGSSSMEVGTFTDWFSGNIESNKLWNISILLVSYARLCFVSDISDIVALVTGELRTDLGLQTHSTDLILK